MSTNYVQKATGASPSGLADSLVYDDGTHVGVGTTSPQVTVQINAVSSGTPSTSDLFIVGNDNLTSDGIKIGRKGDTQDHLDTYGQLNANAGFFNRLARGGTSTKGVFKFRSYDGTAETTLMTLDQVGRIGLGESAPAGSIEVRSTSSGSGFSGTTGSGAIRISYSSGYGVGIDTWDSGTPRWGVLNYNGDTPLVMMEGIYNSPDVVFNSGGKIGVGVTSPAAKVHAVA